MSARKHDLAPIAHFHTSVRWRCVTENRLGVHGRSSRHVLTTTRNRSQRVDLYRHGALIPSKVYFGIQKWRRALITLSENIDRARAGHDQARSCHHDCRRVSAAGHRNGCEQRREGREMSSSPLGAQLGTHLIGYKKVLPGDCLCQNGRGYQKLNRSESGLHSDHIRACAAIPNHLIGYRRTDSQPARQRHERTDRQRGRPTERPTNREVDRVIDTHEDTCCIRPVVARFTTCFPSSCE